MKIKFFIILLIFWQFPETLIAQYSLSGYITDAKNEALPFSNVIVSAKKTKANFFAISNEKGFYELKNLPNDTLLVEVSSMGFVRKKMKVFIQKSDTLSFALTSTTIELSEAIITVKQAVKQSKDTVSYNVSSFSDSTEHNLEELLEKLPGFSVEKEKGTIKVNGQSIKKIYIDGEEISGKNYQLITKNMPTNVVDKVQVLSNFNENILLKGIGESNDVVLNLTINKNKKNIVFGNINLGVGTNKNLDTHTNLFFLGEKFKVLNFVGYNNIGKYSLANRLMEDEPFGADETNFNQNISSQLRTVNNFDLNSFSDLSSQSIIRNDEFSVSTQFSTKPHKNVKVNGGIFYLTDKNNLAIERNSSYRFEATNFTLQENTLYEKKPSILDNHINLDWQINKSSAIHIGSVFFGNSTVNRNLTESNFNSFQNDAQQKSFRLGTIFTYTKRFDEKKGFLFSFLNENKGNDETSKIALANTFMLPKVGELKDFVTQSIQQKITFFNTKATYFYVFGKGKILSGLGLISRNDKLNSALESTVSLNTKNNLNLSSQYLFSFINVNYNFSTFDVFFNNEIGNISTNANLKDRKTYYLPTIGLKKEGLRNFLLLSYKSSVNIPRVYDLTNEVIMTGNRNFEQGFNDEYAIGQSKSFLFNYRYTDYQSTFLSNLNMTYATNDKGYIQDLSFDENYVISSKILNTKSAKRFQISNGTEYYFDKLRLKVKIKPTVFYSEYFNSVNSVLNPYQQTTYSADLSVRSSFKSFNYFGGASISRSNIYNSVSFQKNTIEKGSIFLDFYFKMNKLSGRFQNEILLVKNQSNLNKYLTSSFHATYAFKNKPLKLDFAVRNIFDAKYFINASNFEFYSEFQRTAVIPRYFMVIANYNFGAKNND